jgi:osmotically-inducible protein OsmY
MMKKHSCTSLFAALALASGLVATPLPRQEQGAAQDNTKVNKRDRDSSQPTADQGKNNVSDRELAAKIRREIVKDKNLSTYGHNVKIIAEHGKVTLKGPVNSEDEKQAIKEHARKYVSEGNINDELTVKSGE